MDPSHKQAYQQLALELTQALAARDYSAAYAMCSQEFRETVSLQQLTESFEDIVPTDWGSTDPIATGETMEEWPGKGLSDVGWAYVSIGGDCYSEALVVIVALEDGELKVRDIEFGRP